jgi:dTDP-4-amino-4,6-dideoxygalactose transaminase
VNVRLSDPTLEYQTIRQEIDAAIFRVLESGEYVRGEEVAALEREFAPICGTRHAVVTASGTMALIVALKALGIGAGDEVITAPYTSICTTAAITHAGATIRFADIEDATLTLDPAQVEAAITPRTRALLPVHLHGMVAEMGALREIAERHRLLVIEDAALAVGATYRGELVGSLGHAAGVSFAPSKIVGGLGWGGMMLTDSDAVANRARQLAGFGRTEALESLEVDDLEGYNAQMSSLLAAALRVKLRYLDGWLARRRAIAARYDAACDGLGIRRLHPPPWTTPSYRTYPILVLAREHVIAELGAAGVDAGAHFTPVLHLRPVYQRLGYGRGSFPVAERVTEEIVCLPIHPHLSDDDVESVCAALEHVVTGIAA